MGNAFYTVHSWDIPYAQENTSLNYCWQAHNGDVKLAPFCQVFILRTPGLYKGAKERLHTISFESVCLPGYFLKQKNYHMILQKRDGSDLFGEDIVFISSCCAFIFYLSVHLFASFPQNTLKTTCNPVVIIGLTVTFYWPLVRALVQWFEISTGVRLKASPYCILKES